MRIRSSIVQIAFTIAAASPAAGQSIRVADSLLQRGSLARAESVYYAATRSHPADPGARRALGNFLIARGAPRVGATLLEEAINFGGDRAAIERELGPVYLGMADYHLLAALTTSPAADRERAKWLIAHETRTIAPDSLVVIALRSAVDSGTIGRTQIRLNGKLLDAAIMPGVRGIVVADASAAPLRLHVFPSTNSGTRERGVLAAADTIALGALTIRNVPITIARVDAKVPVAIGIDFLGKFAPTFDAKTSRIILHLGAAAPVVLGDTLATLMLPAELDVLQADGWGSVTRADVARRLVAHRWTFDARRGRMIVEP